jgi:hypothetical protein
MKKVTIEGLLYLLKNIDIIINKIADYDAKLVTQIRIILEADRGRIIEEYQRELKVFKNNDAEKSIEAIKEYDLRNFEHCLYSMLT